MQPPFLLSAAAIAAATAQTLTGTQPLPSTLHPSPNATSPFQIASPAFHTLLGPHPSLSLIAHSHLPLFHEAGVITSLDPLSLFAVSNQFPSTTPSPSTNNKSILLSETTQSPNGTFTTRLINETHAALPLPNGAFAYKGGILVAAQGTLSSPARLAYLPPSSSSAPETVLDNYLGTPLNSPNDVYIARSGAIYFTDPWIGYTQHIRPRPALPPQVYGFAPAEQASIRVVADGIHAPNGVQLCEDDGVAYITDTQNTTDAGLPGARTIYKYDVWYNGQSPVGSFVNKRVFAMPGVGIPDGIKCDSRGNVYAACGDGINIWDKHGDLLGKVLIDNGVSNFGFASDGRLLAMNEERLWLVQLSRDTQPDVRVGETRGG